MFIGKKIKLRRIEKQDLRQLWRWHENRELYLFEKLKPFVYFDELNERFSDFFAWKGDFIVETRSGKPVGVCTYTDIIWKNRSCELAFQICEDDPNQLIVSDMLSTILNLLFNELNMFRVYTVVSEFLSSDISILKNKGFMMEGRLREDVFRDGEYIDVLIYALLKNDFENPPRSELSTGG